MSGSEREAIAEDCRMFADGAVIDGKWAVLAILGRGGNGEVYRVRHLRSGAFGAMKVPCSESHHLHERFDRELEVLQRIASSQSDDATRHFPRIIDIGTAAGKDVRYFVIEFLHDVIQPANESEARELILGATEAVRELHRCGYLHRDIKDRNLMRRDNGDLVLIDFGLAVRIDDVNNPMKRISMSQGLVAGVGTEGWAAPEQLLGHPSVRSDVYSLGAVVKYCFAGKPPPKWDAIASRALNPDQEHRYPNVDDFLSAAKRTGQACRFVAVAGRYLAVFLLGACCSLGVWRAIALQPMIATGGETQPLVRKFSKLKLIKAFKSHGYPNFLDLLRKSGYYDYWDAATGIYENDPDFNTARKSIQEHLGISDADFDDILNESVDEGLH